MNFDPSHEHMTCRPHSARQATNLIWRSRSCALLLALVTSLNVQAQEADIAWRFRVTQGTVTLAANPLGAEQRTAFYLARGFSASAIRAYVNTCGWSIGLRNDGGGTLNTRLADWQAIGADGRRIALHHPQSWEATWDTHNVSRAARIAFRWAQFPAENSFAPGDWIMGMMALESVPIAPFRLVVRYRNSASRGDHEITLDQLACAVD